MYRNAAEEPLKVKERTLGPYQLSYTRNRWERKGQ